VGGAGGWRRAVYVFMLVGPDSAGFACVF